MHRAMNFPFQQQCHGAIRQNPRMPASKGKYENESTRTPAARLMLIRVQSDWRPPLHHGSHKSNLAGAKFSQNKKRTADYN